MRVTGTSGRLMRSVYPYRRRRRALESRCKTSPLGGKTLSRTVRRPRSISNTGLSSCWLGSVAASVDKILGSGAFRSHSRASAHRASTASRGPSASNSLSPALILNRKLSTVIPRFSDHATSRKFKKSTHYYTRIVLVLFCLVGNCLQLIYNFFRGS